MRTALINEHGEVENVVIIDPNPDPIPVFEDGEQVWDENEDGELVPRMRPAPAWTPPEGLMAIDIPDDSPVGLGWRRGSKGWVEPEPEALPEPEVSENERLGAALREVLTDEQIQRLLS